MSAREAEIALALALKRIVLESGEAAVVEIAMAALSEAGWL